MAFKGFGSLPTHRRISQDPLSRLEDASLIGVELEVPEQEGKAPYILWGHTSKRKRIVILKSLDQEPIIEALKILKSRFGSGI